VSGSSLDELAQPAPLVAADEPRAEIFFRRKIRFGAAVRELWTFRELVLTLAERDLRVRYKQAALGIGWAVLAPVLLMLASWLVFTRISKVDTHGVPYPVFSYLGLLPWTFFSSALSSGGLSLTMNVPLLNKVYCPREVFPLGAVVVAAVDAVISSFIFVLLCVATGTTPQAEIVYAPIFLVILLAFTVGVTVAVSVVLVYIRDLRLVLPLVLQFGLFVTPVFYSAESVAKSETRLLIYSALNPLVPVIEGLRDTILYGQSPDWASVGVSAASSVFYLVGGIWLFKRLETGIADIA
jgi:ABC-2 type transport system permease protein/lipopolysaccharide transport system permease protein